MGFVPRPPRDQSPGRYHVTNRGTGPCMIYRHVPDYESFVAGVDDVLDRSGWRCDDICLMGTHYHLLIETFEENLAAGMQRLNGHFAQAFNQRNGRIGALFQGRYRSISIAGDGHLLENVRYFALNPVLAQLCQAPEEWSWSGFSAVVGGPASFPFPVAEEILSLFSPDRRRAIERLRAFVEDGRPGQVRFA